MNSPAIPLPLLPQAGLQQRYPYYSTPFTPSSSSSPPTYQHAPQQVPCHYNDYSLEDGQMYAQPFAYQPVLATPPSTEDSHSGDGEGSPFDDENQLPTPEEFRAIVDDYLNNLSPKKRDKALVDQHRYYLIQQVLRDPRNTAISTAQFRFWVKKMFQLQLGTVDIICHDSKPVAIKEHIYDILVRAHREAHHGGRDKTSALVRRKFSWIPKELVARFVRHCPFCITRRNGGASPDPMKRNSPRYAPVVMPNTLRHYSFDRSSQELSSDKEMVYDCSPNYVTTPYNASPSSRRPSYLYDRESDFLNSYPFEPVSSMIGFRSASASSTNTTNTSASSVLPTQHKPILPFCQDQPTIINDPNTSMFHPQQQNYLYPSYTNNSYYTNMLDMTTACGDGPSVSFSQPASQPTMEHQSGQPGFFNTTPLMPFPDSATSTAAMPTFSADL